MSKMKNSSKNVPLSVCIRHFQLHSFILMRTSAASTLALRSGLLATSTRRRDVPLGTRMWVDFYTPHHSSPPCHIYGSFLMVTSAASVAPSSCSFISSVHHFQSNLYSQLSVLTCNSSSFTVIPDHSVQSQTHNRTPVA